jgi:hypothetical protein
MQQVFATANPIFLPLKVAGLEIVAKTKVCEIHPEPTRAQSMARRR